MKVSIGKYPDDGSDQEVEVSIDPWDTWSMDATLAHIILPMLKQLRDTKQGAPFVDMEDRPKHLRTTEFNKYETDEYHFEAWDWALDEMVFAFTSKFEDWDSQFHTGVRDTWMQPLDANENPIGDPYPWGDGRERNIPGVECYRMVKGPNDTSHFDKDGYTKYQERISNGFRLFGKYYENLWD